MKKILVFLVALSFFHCVEDKGLSRKLPPLIEKSTTYAQGFSIENMESFSILEIKNPWPKADKSYRYALVQDSMLARITLHKDDFDAIITLPIKHIVVTSTTHIPPLELLGVENTLVGFPGTDYISSEKTRALIENNSVREIGENEDINTEILLETNPDLVIGYGVDGTNKTFENIKKSGIPVIYNGDWVETSPLAKAEWIKFFGVLFNKQKDADSIFKSIETEYVNAKKLASEVQNRPSVLAGAMHRDIWYLPSGTSSEAQLLKDANTYYLWAETEEKGSLSLNFETVFAKAKDADIWISPSNYSSLEAMQKANEHYTQFEAFQKKEIYSFANTVGKTGGVLYYELGMARPDLVLKDLIKICHPEILKDYSPYFFKKLE